MSKYVECETSFVSQEALVAALADMGYDKVEIYEAAQSLYGYQGDVRSTKAHIIVRRQYVGRMANDIGYEKMADGKYRAHISKYDLGRHGTNWQKELKVRYAANKVKQNAKKRGIRCKEDAGKVTLPNGKKAIRLEVWR